MLEEIKKKNQKLLSILKKLVGGLSKKFIINLKIKMVKKYKLTKTTRKYGSLILYQIEALIDFGDIKKGEKGGFIKKEENLSQDGNAWVSVDAVVSGDAVVSDNARVYGNAWISGNAWVHGNAKVYGDAWVSDNAVVYGNAVVSGNAWVYGNALVFDNAVVSD
ncbi:MAG: hypothetical protein N2505_06150, partial [Endomicrobia bacterium]|nr:hypothetical protein [Endomicrobiia bacterium]